MDMPRAAGDTSCSDSASAGGAGLPPLLPGSVHGPGQSDGKQSEGATATPGGADAVRPVESSSLGLESLPPVTDADSLHKLLRSPEGATRLAKLSDINPPLAAAARDDDPAVMRGALMEARFAQSKVTEAEVKSLMAGGDAPKSSVHTGDGSEDSHTRRRVHRKHSFSRAHDERGAMDEEEAEAVDHLLNTIHVHSMRKPVAEEHKAYFGAEGTNYERPDSIASDQVLKAMTKKGETTATRLPIVLIVLLGLSVSVMANGVLAVSSLIENWKIGWVVSILDNEGDDGWVAAWGVWVSFGVVCALLGSMFVFIAPAVRSSGIPHVLAFLNGVQMPDAANLMGRMVGPFDTTTLIAKAASTVLTVASGLFLGPEGPLIHMGGIVGQQIVRFLQALTGERTNKILGKITAGHVKPHTERWFPVDMEQQHDFVAIGAGAAISGAFSAPLAGVLFVVEEASSKFSISLLGLSFLACSAAFFLTWMVMPWTFIGDGHVKFGKPASSFCSLYNWADGISFLILAMLGGLVGAAFNSIVVRLNKWRQHAIMPYPMRQVAEVFAVVVVTCSAAVLIPAFWSCTESRPQLMMEGGVGCLREEDWTQLSPALVSHADAVKFYGGVDGDGDAVSPLQLNERERQWLADNLDPNDTTSLIYLARNMSEVPYVTFFEAHEGSCMTGSFNELATLFLKGSVKAVTMLLTRGAPHIFSPGALILFFIVYTLLAAYTSGISLASGLFIPHLLIGGSMGRLAGLLDLWLITEACVGDTDIDPENMSVLEWTLSGYRESLVGCVAPDPGTYAMIGAAAVMAGSGRITVFLAVVMLELTGDLQFLPVIAATTLIAMMVGNTINHGLYHSLIPLLGVPFLETEPHPAQAVQPIRRVMASPVVALHAMMTKAQLEAVLNGFDWLNAVDVSDVTSDSEGSIVGKMGELSSPSAAKFDPKVRKHHAFPVVTSHDHVIGIVERDLLQHIVDVMEDSRRARKERRRQKRKLEAAGTNGMDPDAVAVAVDLEAAADAEDADQTTIDLRRVMQRAPYVVYEQTSIARAFDLFRSLGLRHLCVIEHNGKLVGIVTRKDLMTWRLQHELDKSLLDWASEPDQEMPRTQSIYPDSAGSSSPSEESLVVRQVG